MLCEVCSKNQATVRITEIGQETSPEGQKTQSVSLKHLCSKCAQQLEIEALPPTVSKNVAHIMSMLEQAGRKRPAAEPPCPRCGMTLAEFRSKGRLGCAHDYQHFAKHLEPLLKRMHNATSHLGRLPGVDEAEQQRRTRVGELRQQLDAAIRDEAYETAARLRDELARIAPALESGAPPAAGG
ncbi:MAG: hypothetical protein EPO68_15835 [Planctomycetota bacterium]|nr:MAG: hypothetical protein EPO68_15835 [Planctomycetota bacterium]